jgi:hypothetical protein
MVFSAAVVMETDDRRWVLGAPPARWQFTGAQRRREQTGPRIPKDTRAAEDIVARSPA